jgi:hypothetical protein
MFCNIKQIVKKNAKVITRKESKSSRLLQTPMKSLGARMPK